MDDMQFSIVIPTLNEENYVGRLLDDLGAQDFKDFEVIHVDGKSKDKTCDVVSTYQDKLVITTVVSPRRNVSHQKNLGADRAKGKYLIFIDADTRILDPLFLSKLASATHRSKHMMYMPIVGIEEEDPGLKLTFAIYNKAIEASKYLSTPIPSIGLAVFERNFFHHLGGYIPSPRHEIHKLFPEDYEIVMRAKKMGVAGCVAHHARFVYSLRRFKQEGYMKVVPKYILSVVEQLLGREFIEHNYEMGGHLYDEPNGVDTR